MTAALIGTIRKEDTVKVRLDLPKSLYEELVLYANYSGGCEGDIPEVSQRMIEYVLDRENKGSQGKKYKEFKQQFSKKSKENISENQIE